MTNDIRRKLVTVGDGACGAFKLFQQYFASSGLNLIHVGKTRLLGRFALGEMIWVGARRVFKRHSLFQ
jgi:hypothetical protein